jgi:hypothetical protein
VLSQWKTTDVRATKRTSARKRRRRTWRCPGQLQRWEDELDAAGLGDDLAYEVDVELDDGRPNTRWSMHGDEAEHHVATGRGEAWSACLQGRDG